MPLASSSYPLLNERVLDDLHRLPRVIWIKILIWIFTDIFRS
jgi:hypothetical protein